MKYRIVQAKMHNINTFLMNEMGKYGMQALITEKSSLQNLLNHEV